MDFHSLTRKELQSLCKLNKIPANITNVGMADALQSLDIVEGIEKFMKVTQSETANQDESKENAEELSSAKVPTTRCRATTQKKVKTTEPENLRPTGTRTTRRTAKKLTGGVEESKKDAMETPALSSTRRNVHSQLNECDLEAKEDEKSPVLAVVTKSRRKVATTSTAVRNESTVQKTYSRRRSTRQTETKSGETRVMKESETVVEINSMLDEINVASDEVLTVDVSESTVNAGNPNAQVDNICNAFEELVVVVEDEEKEDCNLKPESDEISNLHEECVLEEERNDIKSCENEEKHERELMVIEQHPDSIIGDNSHTESGVDDAIIPCNTEMLGHEEGMFCDVSEMNKTEAPNDETLDVSPTIDSLSPITDEASEVTYGFAGCFINESNQLSQNPSALFDHIGLPTGVSKNDMLNDCQQEEANATAVTTYSKEIEKSVKIDLLLDEVNVTFQEVLPVEVVEENTMDAGGNPDAKMEEVCNYFDKPDVMVDESAASHKREEDIDNVKLESDESSSPCEEDGDSEVNQKVGENFEMREEEDVKPESDKILLSPCQSVDKLEMVTEEEQHKDGFLDDDNAETQSGSSTMVNDMVLNNNEIPKDSLNMMDNVNNFSPTDEEENTKDESMILEGNNTESKNSHIFGPAHVEEDDIKQGSENEVEDETLAEADIVVSIPTPMKKMSNVSDDKENRVIVFGNKSNKEKDESLQDKSLRQLRKQLKALTLKTINSNNNQDAAAAATKVKEVTARPALQALCDNQLVGGETMI